MIVEKRVTTALDVECPPGSEPLTVLDAYDGCLLDCPYCFQRSDPTWNTDVVVKTNIVDALRVALEDWPEGWSGYTVTAHDQASLEETIYRIARGLVADDWRVLVGVTGHDVQEQRDAIHDGIQRACAGVEAKGFGVMEGENWHGGASMQYSMDHAGAWETSVMMYAHGERVSLGALREQMEASGRADVETMKMKEPEGIGGWNPLKYASANLGHEIVSFCAGRIGQRAMDVLEGQIEPPHKADGTLLDNPGPTD